MKYYIYFISFSCGFTIITGLRTHSYRNFGFWLGKMKFWNYNKLIVFDWFVSMRPNKVFSWLPLNWIFESMRKSDISCYDMQFFLSASKRWNREAGVKVGTQAKACFIIQSFRYDYAVFNKKSISFFFVFYDVDLS